MGVGGSLAGYSGVLGGNLRGRRLDRNCLTGVRAEPSQGSHFFHNISTLGINYVMVADNTEDFLDWRWLTSLPVVKETTFVAHVEFANPFVLKVDGRSSRCVIYLAN